MSDSDDTAPLHVSAGQMLLSQVVLVAAGAVGVREEGGRNRGPMVDRMIRSVGLEPTNGSYPWCACFVYWCFDVASKSLHMPKNPCVRTAGVLSHWQRAPEAFRIKVHPGGTVVDRERIRPGCVFLHESGEGKGHCGIVEGVDFALSLLNTIEGNTDDSGGREGDGVYRRVRKLDYVNLGFVDYGRAV